MRDLLSRLFRRNPTANWRETGEAITIDLAACKVNGRGFRARTADFAFLGPADDWPAKNGSGSLIYPKRGLQLDFEYDHFIGLTVALQKPPYQETPRQQPFVGRFILSGRPLELSAGMAEAQLLNSLGQPASFDRDEEEVVVCYSVGDVVADFEVDADVGLYCVTLICEGEVSPA